MCPNKEYNPGAKGCNLAIPPNKVICDFGCSVESENFTKLAPLGIFLVQDAIQNGQKSLLPKVGIFKMVTKTILENWDSISLT